MPVSLTIWRCTRCEKWSHAKRKPRFHQRWISDDGNEINPDNGWFENCGPFEEWTTYKVDKE